MKPPQATPLGVFMADRERPLPMDMRVAMNARLLALLRAGRVTVDQARDHGIFRPGMRVSDLRSDGHAIATERDENQRVTGWTLEKEHKPRRARRSNA